MSIEQLLGLGAANPLGQLPFGQQAAQQNIYGPFGQQDCLAAQQALAAQRPIAVSKPLTPEEQQDAEREAKNRRNERLWRARFERDPLQDVVLS